MNPCFLSGYDLGDLSLFSTANTFSLQRWSKLPIYQEGSHLYSALIHPGAF